MSVQAALEQREQVVQFLRKHRIGLLTLLFTDIVEELKKVSQAQHSKSALWPTRVLDH
jgi:hypothetical protein